MKALHAGVAVLVAAISVTTVAAAAPDAAKQRVVITVKGRGIAGKTIGTFRLLGAASDSGTSHVIGNTTSAHQVLGGGYKGTSRGPGQLDGKKGDLSFWWSGLHVTVTTSTYVTTGTWRIKGGTGIYETAKGGGTFVSVAHNAPSVDNHTPSGVGSYEARFEGLVSR